MAKKISRAKAKKSTMTRKEAHRILDQLANKYTHMLIQVGQYNLDDPFIDQVYNALRVLLPVIYGPVKAWQTPYPCEICHGRYTEHYAKVQGQTWNNTWCCTPCYDQLKAEGKLVESEVQA